MKLSRENTWLAIAFWLVALAPGIATAQSHWVGTWAASQQLVEPQNAIPATDARDVTLRQIVHVSIGGNELRVYLSNRFGTSPLHIDAVHIAEPVSADSPKIVPGTDTPLTFSGQPDVTLPAGADYVSDPVQFPLAALSNLAITLHVDALPEQQTGHPGSRATSYAARGGAVSAPDLPEAAHLDHWYFIAGIDVLAPADAAAIVALGDSITDGHGSTENGNTRWTDFLAKRLQTSSAARALAVLNHGIGGNRLALDGLGPSASARFDHDVLAQAGVRYLIVLEGINDIGMLTRDGDVSQPEHDALVRRLLVAYQQIITKSHTHGIKVIGATILPFAGSQFYHPGPASEADRRAINQWIRVPGHFDAVVDFDDLMRDPQHPDRLLPAYDSGDHLHPSPAGYAAMADAIPLSLFVDNSSAPAGTPQIAFTFDDLPAHGPLPPGETRVEVISKIIAALQEAHVPPTYGFVIGDLLKQQPAGAAVLKAWRAAGNLLGNHTWSHMNLNEHTLQEFEADVTANEPILSRWMQDEDWHWFRFPFLAEGDTPEKRAGIRAFLLRDRYKIAGVTMNFGDYEWNEPYARCRAKGDAKAIATLESSYLAAADQNIRYQREASQTLLGRDIPYVLLMHVGAFDAEMLPRLLDLYRTRGFQFVGLDQAERDSFYAQDTDLGLPPGPDTLEQALAEQHRPLPPHPPPPVPLDTVCR
ncbi:MAG TPA: GDSL-type esterase/lipase family protein [Candidatus Acidoferrales bacterium]|nr:GDSL-type esterase/lipase family protein [Candidatus Acidoferrales bacterium]